MLVGVTPRDGSTGSMSSGRTSTLVQEAVAAAQSSAGMESSAQVAFGSSDGSRSGACAAEAARWQQNAQQVAAWAQQLQQSTQKSAQNKAAAGGCCAGAGGCSSTAGETSAAAQLVINAGWGRVELKAMGWMDGLKARMQAKNSNSEV